MEFGATEEPRELRAPFLVFWILLLDTGKPFATDWKIIVGLLYRSSCADLLFIRFVVTNVYLGRGVEHRLQWK